MSTVAIVGGGLFGATAAIILARAGHSVSLFEQRHDLLLAASGINQYRLHAGYHYPRSPETGRQSRRGLTSFQSEFAEAIVHGGAQYYAVAREGSRTTADQFEDFCRDEGLAVDRLHHVDFISPEHVEAVFAVQEARIDVVRLRELVWSRLKLHGVRVLLNSAAGARRLADFDWIVIAGYASNNSILVALDVAPTIKQYELCEKPVVQMPARLRQTSIVVIDGPFMCMDPMGAGSRHVWGHVSHGIHATTEGDRPHIPTALWPMLDAGIVASPPQSNFEKFRLDGARFIPDFLESRHLGSMFTLKVVPFGVDATDERPTDVMHLGRNVIAISSGKLSTAVSAAREVSALLADDAPRPARLRIPEYGAG
jgi:hypothetical protein